MYKILKKNYRLASLFPKFIMSTTILAPSPLQLPKNLTSLSSSYMLKATLAVGSIILFFILYITLIVSLGYLSHWAIFYEIDDVNKLTVLAKVGAVAGSVMLFVFSLKFIFKLKNYKPDNRIKLNKNESQELFDFVYQICKETGAPKPKSIYLDPDVNAYVSYTNVWLSLIFPTRKELTIGLGLVSTLNLSEFKAVTAHEFGHFAQKSMKIGSYIHSANTIIHDMIFNRDKWDHLLEQWRSSDIRLSAAAWAITPIIWLIRKLLESFYTLLNYMHSALSREMEFNADKVAIKTTGSVAIVSALWKLDFGSTYWNNIINHAYHASKKNVYTNNLYYHNLKLIDSDKSNIENKLEELTVETNGSKQFFNSSNNSMVSMYASHPPNDHREKSAKNPFVFCEIDSRSPWLLFNNSEEIQKKMTLLVYDKYLNKNPDSFVAFEDFENFIAAESRNLDLVNEYQNTFENRFITIPNLEKFKEIEPFVGDFSLRLEDLKNKLQKLMLPVKDIESQINKVQQISGGEINEKSILYKEIEYSKKNLQECYILMLSDRDKILNEDFKEWDELFITSNFKLAKSVNQENELLNYYKQHQAIIGIYQKLIEAKNNIINKINSLNSQTDVTQDMVYNLSGEINDYVKDINVCIDSLDKIAFISISNIDTIQELKEAILEGGKINVEQNSIFDNGGLDRIMNAIESGIVHCNRIENKNLDHIMAFQKTLQENN